MRKEKHRSSFRTAMDIFGYVMAVIVGLGLIGLIRHIILHHF
jgi:hypothetical protein